MIISILAADQWFENLMLALRTPSLVRVFEGVTFFGSVPAIIVLAGITGLVLVSSRRNWSYLAGLVVSLTGAAATGYVLKVLVGRLRPDGLIPAIVETGFSFPSGHAVASMAFYGFLAFLISRRYPEYRKIVLTFAAIIILTIGASRLYLGVHFPSDVLGGYALGALWLWLGVLVTRKLSAD
jgi:undecaprenyl-diphosphatase